MSLPAYEISFDPGRVDVEAVHAFLSTSYPERVMELHRPDVYSKAP